MTNNVEFWKEKLAAYLHDPPSKCLDLATHEDRSEQAYRQAGFGDEEVGRYIKDADHVSAAADRIPFPAPKASGMQCAFDGVRNRFIHPLGNKGGGKLTFRFDKEFPSAELAIEGENSVQPCLTEKSLAGLRDDAERWRARFFAHWRLWRKHAVETDYRLGFLPADTRIPDHPIWLHMQITSAMAGCMEDGKINIAFLKFQIGPVQDFIAAARSIRDLWSGSYLLSWLMASGLKALTEEVGPDAVIYPSLYGQPIFDLHWRDDLWNKVNIGSETVWASFKYKEEELLTPNIPNVFLAIIPQKRADELAKKVESRIRDEWKKIAKAVWKYCADAGLTADEGGITEAERERKYFEQVERFLSISYQATPMPEELEEALKLGEGFHSEMPISKAYDRVNVIKEMAEKLMPEYHRDGRYYTDASKSKLHNVGLAWAVGVGFNAWCLDAVRQVRTFDAVSGGWEIGTFCNKDVLNGKEEAVAGGRKWQERCGELVKSKSELKPLGLLFKHDDWVGASTLIKRVWHLAYLSKEPWNLRADSSIFPMPNTRGIGAHEPLKDCGEYETADDVPMEEKYFAVIALDGDEMGKWISGDKTPPFRCQLADYTDGSGNRTGALEYFERESYPDSDTDTDNKGTLKKRFENFLNTPRPVSPSYHLQFSEALSNFALYFAKPIVEIFDGRLIYAGGDDVLALVPSDTALACAKALRMAFRGDPSIKEFLIIHAQKLKVRHEDKQKMEKKNSSLPYYQKLAAEQEGLIRSDSEGFLCRFDMGDKNGIPIPFIVPGPAADCSIGIAIGHFKAPLQDMVRAAQKAEKLAKNKYGRAAVCINLFKRSGEIIEWGCKWDNDGLALYHIISEAMENKKLSSRFPHRMCEFLGDYLSNSTPLCSKFKTIDSYSEFDARLKEIISKDFEFVLNRQSSMNKNDFEEFKEKAVELLNSYLTSLSEFYDKKFADGNGSKISRSDFICSNLIGLFQTIAFANRIQFDETEENSTDNSKTRQTTLTSR